MLIGLGLFLAAFPILIGTGLWLMKPWGWYLVVIIQSLGLIAVLLNLCFGIFVLLEDPGQGIATIIGVIVGGVLNGAILYWFITNRVLFQIGVPKEGSNSQAITALIVGGGFIFILCLVPVVVIALLTLLGPQIGNVFSQITSGLSATPMPR